MENSKSKTSKENKASPKQKSMNKSEKTTSKCGISEKDGPQDLLNVEKTVVKMYTTAITEGVSKGFRQTVKKNFTKSTDDQIDVFFLMTELGYAEVKSAPEQIRGELKQKFTKVQPQLA